ncbi:MAG: metalloregulator ArsR/SmtB family transcription factor [Patescibacteria group bacterium]
MLISAYMTGLCKEMEKLGKGIGNANRYRMLEAMMKGQKTVGEIAMEVRLTQPNVSQNLKILKSANLVSSKRKGREVYYSINVAYMMGVLKGLAGKISACKKKTRGLKNC